MKRKKMLDNDENKVLLGEKINYLEIHKQNNMLSKKMQSNETWFCPRFEPPSTKELENSFKVNNEPYVKYYKTKDKFKMVNILIFF